MFACDPSIAFLLFGKQQTAKFSRRMTKNQKGQTTWTMREAFQEVSPCRTTTTSVNSSSPLGAAAGVGDMVRLVAAAAASFSLCRSREGGYPPDILPGFTGASRKEPRRWPLLQPDAAGLDGCCGHQISQSETILAPIMVQRNSEEHETTFSIMTATFLL